MTDELILLKSFMDENSESQTLEEDLINRYQIMSGYVEFYFITFTCWIG